MMDRHLAAAEGRQAIDLANHLPTLHSRGMDDIVDMPEPHIVAIVVQVAAMGESEEQMDIQTTHLLEVSLSAL